MTAWQFFGWVGLAFYALAYYGSVRGRDEDADFHLVLAAICWVIAFVVVLVGIVL